ncbi:MAG: glycosyltransferase [Microthrixaceae bacterium]
MADPRSFRRRLADVLPPGTRRRDVADGARRIADVLAQAGTGLSGALDPGFSRAPLDGARWLALHHRENEATEVRQALSAGPCGGSTGTGSLRVRFVVDARAADDAAVARSLASLDAQWCSTWEAETAGDDSTLARAVQRAASDGDRSPLVVLRAGDVLRPDLVARVLDAFLEDPSLEMVHWDEAVGGADGLRFLPSWSPDLLLSANAWGRCFALRNEHWRSFDPSDGDGAWWAVLLGAGLVAERVRRLCRVGTTTADRHDPTPASALGPVSAELARRGWPARPIGVDSAVWLDWALQRWPKVSIVVPSRHSRSLLDPLLASLRTTDYPDFEVVVIDNSGRDDAKAGWYTEHFGDLDARVLWWDEQPFNYSAVNNHGAARSAGEVLVFLNDDTEARSPVGCASSWAGLRAMRSEPSVPSCWTPRAASSTGAWFSEWMLRRDTCSPGMPDSDSMLGSTRWVRNVLASTAACVAVRREVFEACGGFDERFELCGSDVVLGIEAHIRGWRNVVVPGTGMRHMESATRDPAGGVRTDLFASWWHYQRWLTAGDPYFSPSLSLESHWPTLRPPGERPAAERMLEAMERPHGVFRQELLEETSRGWHSPTRSGTPQRRSGFGPRRGVGSPRCEDAQLGASPFDNPFYGGLATITRLADLLARSEG